MITSIWVALLAILPLLESLHREAGLVILTFASCVIGLRLLIRQVFLDRTDMLLAMFLLVLLPSTFFSTSLLRSFTEFLRYAAYFIILIGLKNSADPYLKKRFVQGVFSGSLLLTGAFIATNIPW